MGCLSGMGGLRSVQNCPPSTPVDDNVNHVVCGRGLHSSTSQLNLSR